MTAFTNYFWKILIKKNLRRWWLFLPPGTQFCIWHQDKSKHTQVQQEPSRTTTTEARTVLISISRLVPDGFFFFYFLEGGTSFIFLISLDFSIKNTVTKAYNKTNVNVFAYLVTNALICWPNNKVCLLLRIYFKHACMWNYRYTELFIIPKLLTAKYRKPPERSSIWRLSNTHSYCTSIRWDAMHTLDTGV